MKRTFWLFCGNLFWGWIWNCWLIWGNLKCESCQRMKSLSKFGSELSHCLPQGVWVQKLLPKLLWNGSRGSRTTGTWSLVLVGVSEHFFSPLRWSQEGCLSLCWPLRANLFLHAYLTVIRPWVKHTFSYLLWMNGSGGEAEKSQIFSEGKKFDLGKRPGFCMTLPIVLW